MLTLTRSFPRRIEHANLPNAASTVGLVCAVAWLMGAGPGFAVASIILDEVDGTLARMTGQTSSYGAEYDYTIDIALQGAVAMKIGAPWLLLVTVPISAAGKIKGGRPMLGSWRALGMVYGIARGM
jgi:phosphatidylglycerophosphate synthase